MGYEIFYYGIPEDFIPFQEILRGERNGEELQDFGWVFKDILRTDTWRADLSKNWTNAELSALIDKAPDFLAEDPLFNVIRERPGYLAVCHNLDGVRTHDHWAYLLELVDGVSEKIAHDAVFGTSDVSPTALSTQGFKIRWSSFEQVAIVYRALSKVNLDRVSECFEGFPKERYFYKRVSDDNVEWCLKGIPNLIKFYERATKHKLAVVMVTD